MVNIINGDDGDNNLTGTGSKDEIRGLSGDDTLYGRGGDDKLIGGDGDDYLYGGDGNDTLSGGLGDDYLQRKGGPNETGDDEQEFVSFDGAVNGVTVNLRIHTAQNTGEGMDTIVDFTSVRGSAFADELTGDAKLYGGGGDDILHEGLNMFGEGGNDTLINLHNNDGSTMDGGSGDDIMIDGPSGRMFFRGGSGSDMIDYSASRSGITVDLTVSKDGKVEAYTLGGDIDDIYDVEGFRGSAFADVLLGNGSANHLEGNNGADRLTGREGADELMGGANNDVLTGGSGTDGIHGGDGDDILSGGRGADVIDGGDGVDTITFADTSNAIHIRLSKKIAQGTGEGIDTITRVENVIGSGYDDAITGSGGDNHLQGGGGNDLLRGGEGRDIIDGGEGIDTISFAGNTQASRVDLRLTTRQDTREGRDIVLNIENVIGSAFGDRIAGNEGDNRFTGGAGADRFIFDTNSGADLITDFSVSEGDRIELAGEPVSIMTSGSDTVIDLGGGNTITLTSVLATTPGLTDHIFSA